MFKQVPGTKINRVPNPDDLIKYHGIGEHEKEVIVQENLAPTSLLKRLHNAFPEHSLLNRTSYSMFSEAKNKYFGLSGFKAVCKILEANGIFLTHMEEREFFLQVYAFLATKHILSTIDWNNYEEDQVFQLIFPQPGMIDKKIVNKY